MIVVPYACTRKQFNIGRKLLAAPGLSAVRARRRELRFRSFLGWILFSIFTVILLRLLPRTHRPQMPEPTIWRLWGLYAAAVGMLLVFAGMRLFRWSAWSDFRRKSRETSLAFSEAGVEQLRPGVRTVMHWEHFSGVAERKNVYAIRQHGGDGIIVPQSLFSPADLPEIDRLLKEKLATKVPLLAAGFEVRRS